MRTAHVNQTAQPGPPDRPSGAVPAARARLCGVASLLAAVAITLAWVGGAGASVADPPGAVLARYQGGAQVSDGVRTVTVSQSAELQPGQSIAVNGVGFDVDKGVYVGLCLVPPAGAVPSPCAGGEDRSGSSGASAWFFVQSSLLRHQHCGALRPGWLLQRPAHRVARAGWWSGLPSGAVRHRHSQRSHPFDRPVPGPLYPGDVCRRCSGRGPSANRSPRRAGPSSRGAGAGDDR